MTQKIIFHSPYGQLIGTLSRPNDAPSSIIVMMHGFMANQRYRLFRWLTKTFLSKGFATLTFDFDGHGKSEGRFQDMTVYSELEDAKCVYLSVSSWEWVQDIHLIGHSQGGVVTGLLAGWLSQSRKARLPKSICLLAAAAVLHDDAIEGHIMNAKFDPQHIPEYVRVFFIKKVGRAYFQVAQQLDIYGDTSAYKGAVCLIHGTHDKIVPEHYSHRYAEVLPQAELHILPKEGHGLTGKKKEIIDIITTFILSQ